MRMRIGKASHDRFQNHVVVQTAFALDGEQWAHGGALIVPRRAFEGSFLARLEGDAQIECELVEAEAWEERIP